MIRRPFHGTVAGSLLDGYNQGHQSPFPSATGSNLPVARLMSINSDLLFYVPFLFPMSHDTVGARPAIRSRRI